MAPLAKPAICVVVGFGQLSVPFGVVYVTTAEHCAGLLGVTMLPGQLIVGRMLSELITTSSEEDGQGALLMVHRRVFVLPGVRVKGEFGMDGFTIVPPVPETTVQLPVPTVGVLPVKVVDVLQST